jgi:hypothetical protein
VTESVIDDAWIPFTVPGTHRGARRDPTDPAGFGSGGSCPGRTLVVVGRGGSTPPPSEDATGRAHRRRASS